jgi:hypothetical protein
MAFQRNWLYIVQSHTVELEGPWTQTGWYSFVEVCITGATDFRKKKISHLKIEKIHIV